MVAPPLMVTPPVCVPLPKVDEARAYMPCEKPMSVEVALALVEPNVVGVNGNADTLNPA